MNSHKSGYKIPKSLPQGDIFILKSKAFTIPDRFFIGVEGGVPREFELEEKEPDKKSIIVSGFPGVGKTHLTKNRTGETSIVDLESSEFSWVKDEFGNNTDERNKMFPYNYIMAIEDSIGIYDIILISSHGVLRTALEKEGVNFVLAYPKQEMKEVYLDRYRDRGNDEQFIQLMDSNWTNFIEQCERQRGCVHLVLEDSFLSDVIK